MMISNKKVLTATLFILLFSGVTIQSIPLSLAKRGTQIAEFSCYAVGRGLVIWGGTIGSSTAIYAEDSVRGFVSFGGSALVEEVPDLNEWYGSIKPKSLQSNGVLVAEWDHNGDSYSLMIRFHSTKRTSGLFNPKIDSFTIPVFFVPEPPPEEQFMFYEGVLAEKHDDGYTSRTISGWVALTVYLHLDIYRLVVIFELALEDGTSILVTIEWLNQDFPMGDLYIYRASMFYHNVNLKKEWQ